MHVKIYHTREFAGLAGVTARTLRYYDREGLLQPAQRTARNHRLYQQHDLLRLQQILTLKAMGFSLEEIRCLLSDPIYDIQRALRIQKAAIDQRIEQLRQESHVLEQTLQELETASPLDWTQVAELIRIVSGENKQQWLRAYFTDEQLARLARRQMPKGEVGAGERAWSEVIAPFRKLRHLPVDHPDVQLIAVRMADLLEQFTQGDPEHQASLNMMYQHFEQIPEAYRLHDEALQRFMGEALHLYHKRRATA